MADTRPLSATLRALADSPVPVAEAYFDPETGNLTRVVLAPRFKPTEKKEPDYTPHLAAPNRKTAINSLRVTHEGKMSAVPESE